MKKYTLKFDATKPVTQNINVNLGDDISIDITGIGLKPGEYPILIDKNGTRYDIPYEMTNSTTKTLDVYATTDIDERYLGSINVVAKDTGVRDINTFSDAKIQEKLEEDYGIDKWGITKEDPEDEYAIRTNADQWQFGSAEKYEVFKGFLLDNWRGTIVNPMGFTEASNDLLLTIPLFNDIAAFITPATYIFTDGSRWDHDVSEVGEHYFMFDELWVDEEGMIQSQRMKCTFPEEGRIILQYNDCFQMTIIWDTYIQGVDPGHLTILLPNGHKSVCTVTEVVEEEQS